MPDAPGALTVERHPHFDHVALFHDGPLELADRLAPQITAAVEAGDAVLVCSPEVTRRTLTALLGGASERVTFIPDGVRYDHPSTAMRMLHGFVADALRTGARAVWSIGTLPFGAGAAQDRAWARYEAAVTDVLRDLPLKAVCTYDVSLTSDELVDVACRTHTAAEDGHGRRELAAHPAPEMAEVPPIPLPDARPVLTTGVVSPGQARREMAAACTGLDPDALHRLLTVVSELVTNALLHGCAPVELRAWAGPGVEPATTIVDVSDRGTGVRDPYFDLRPPRSMPGGAGLWIVGQLSDRVTSRCLDGVHHVTASVRHDVTAR